MVVSVLEFSFPDLDLQCCRDPTYTTLSDRPLDISSGIFHRHLCFTRYKTGFWLCLPQMNQFLPRVLYVSTWYHHPHIRSNSNPQVALDPLPLPSPEHLSCSQVLFSLLNTLFSFYVVLYLAARMAIFLNVLLNNHHLSKHKSDHAFRVKFKIIIVAPHDLSLPYPPSFIFSHTATLAFLQSFGIFHIAHCLQLASLPSF